MDMDMTPINRLIPQSSGSQEPHRSEREVVRESMGGPAMTAPIRPVPSREVPGDDIVSEILRDTEGNAHPSEYQEPEYPERTVRFEDEYEPTPPPPPSQKTVKKEKDEDDTDYIGMIFDEMKLPLIVALLILGASSTSLDGTIGKFIPMLVNDGSLGYGGIIVKAIIGALLFYSLRRIFL